MIKPSTAVAAILLLAGPVFAADESVPVGKPASIRVSAADLDLSQPSGQRALQLRIAKAIAEACNPSGVYYPDLTIDKDCARDISAKADAIVQQLATKTTARRLAQR